MKLSWDLARVCIFKHISILMHNFDKDMGFSAPQRLIAFDSKALNGLRGFAAFHIMILHVFSVSSPGFDTFGQVSLISFFIVHK